MNVIITGASSGIGKSIATLLSRSGATVHLVGRDESRLEQLADHLDGHRWTYTADLANPLAVVDIFKKAVAASGPLSGLVHAAGIHKVEPLRFYSRADLCKIFDINLIAAFELMNAFRKKGNHTVEASAVLLSSAAALRPTSGLASYAASKAGLEAAAKVWAAELAKEGIRVNTVAPGYVQTAMLEQQQQTVSQESFAKLHAQHLLGFGEPEDVAKSVQFLLSDSAKWITGSNLVIDGGFTL